MKYHPEVGLPKSICLPLGTFKVKASFHAYREANKDNVQIPSRINTANAKLFEVVTNDLTGRIEKLGYRLAITHSHDICMVVNVSQPVWVCVTCWLNHKADHHSTLRRCNYAVA